MFVQIKRFIVSEGNSEKIVARFGSKKDQPSLMEQQPGFISKELLVKKTRRGEEEVLVMVRWESEEAWKGWEKSPEHIAGHKANAGQPKPDYIIDSSNSLYYVQ